MLAELKVYLERQNRDMEETKKGVRWAMLSANRVILCCSNVIQERGPKAGDKRDS